MLTLQFLVIFLVPLLARQVDRFEEHVGRTANLLQRQEFAAENELRRRQLLPDSCAEQSAENRHVQMTMDAPPTPTLEVIPAEFFLHLAETAFHRPPPKRHPQQVAQRPTVSARNSVAEEILHFTGEHIAGYEERPLATDQVAAVRLSPASVPLDFPHLGTVAGVLDAVSLGVLIREARRVLGEILDFTRAGITACQTRVLRASPGPVWRRFSQHFGGREPNVKVRRHLADEGFTTLLKSIQKLTVATVEFIKRPGFDLNPVGFGASD